MKRSSMIPSVLRCSCCRDLARLATRQLHTSFKLSAESDASPSGPSHRPLSKKAARSASQFREIQNLKTNSAPRQHASSTGNQERGSSNRVNAPPPGFVIRRSDARQGQAAGSPRPQRQHRASQPSRERRGVEQQSARDPRKDGGKPSSRRLGSRRQDAKDADEEEEIPTNYEILMENSEHFRSMQELEHYAQLMDFIGEYDTYQSQLGDSAEKNIPERATEDSERQPDLIQHEFSEKLRVYDDTIKEALQHIVDTDDNAVPRHIPEELPPTKAFKGKVGGVPIGVAGLGNVVEDGLRHLTNRVGNEWERPQGLARRLVDGNFVKFRDLPEKREVLELSEEVAYEPGEVSVTPKVGFEGPSEETKRELVTRLVKGNYLDPRDKELKGNVLRRIARIAHGNGTYKRGDKDFLLDTVREMMPEERAGGAGGQSQK